MKEILEAILADASAEEFATIDLHPDRVPNLAMGYVFENLIRRFNDQANEEAGDHFTPGEVIRLMAHLIYTGDEDIYRPGSARTVYDPACGTGGMLLAGVEYVRGHGGDVRTLLGNLNGQEKNLTTSAIARMNLLLHDVEDANVVRGDTLREPKFLDGDELMKFDCVVANPPFSLKNWGEGACVTDPWGRQALGVPPKGYADWAWVQHMLISATPKTGRVAVVLPQGALFRQGAEARIRSLVVRADLVDAVIGLAPNLFYGTGLAACVLILRLGKPAERKGKVLFINGEQLFKRGRSQNTMEPEHAQEILAAYQNFKDVDGLARVVPLEDIAGNDFNLNIPLYVAPAETGEQVTLADALADLEAAHARVLETRAALEAELAKLGLAPEEVNL